MNAVDVANELRANITVHRPQNYKWWKPIWYWLFDICVNNAYLLWKRERKDTAHDSHRRFYKELANSLLGTPLFGEGEEHIVLKSTTAQRCRIGDKVKGHCKQGSNKRVFGAQISGNSRPNKDARAAQIRTYCKACGVHLFTTEGKDCWALYHSIS